MTLNLSVDEVLTTTRSVRKRLDFDKPVSREVLMECLELALQAPTGSNSQGWQWVFVEDADKKKAIAEIYLANARGYLSSASPEYAEGDTRGDRMGAVRDSATYLAEHMHEAPVLLIPCIEGGRLVAAGRCLILGVAIPRGLEFLSRTALPWVGLLLDDAAPDSRW